MGTGRKAVSISGFSNSRKVDGKITGIFTHAMLLGVDKIGQLGIYHKRDKKGYLGSDELYSLGMLYNATLLENAAVFANRQGLTIQCTADASADTMPWPLIPRGGTYEAPLRQQALGHLSPAESDDPAPAQKGGIQALLTGCVCHGPSQGTDGKDMVRVSPMVLEKANLKNVQVAIDPKDYLEMIQGTDLSLKVARSCHNDQCVLS